MFEVSYFFLLSKASLTKVVCPLQQGSQRIDGTIRDSHGSLGPPNHTHRPTLEGILQASNCFYIIGTKQVVGKSLFSNGWLARVGFGCWMLVLASHDDDDDVFPI